MDSSPETLISKLLISKTKNDLSVSDHPIYVLLTLKPNNTDIFQIKLFTDTDIWCGALSYDNEFTAKCKESLQISSNEAYINILKQQLSGASDDFMYELDFSGSKGTFTWKEKKEDFTIRRGVLSIEKDHESSKSKNTLIELLLNKNEVLHREKDEYVIKVLDLEKQMAIYDENLRVLCAEKLKLEETLYAKFLKILNTKKRRIQLLEKEIT